MEFLKKVENFLNDKAKIVEDTINNTLNNVSNQVDLNSMLDQASDKMNGLLGGLNVPGTQNSGTDMNGNTSTVDCNMGQPMNTGVLGYTGETVSMETKQAIDLYPETVLNKEFGAPVETAGVSLKKDTEKHGVSLKK